MKSTCPALTFALGICLVAGAAMATVAQRVERLGAPTYYIAASIAYGGDPSELHVRGASNLPSGSRLRISVLRYIGEGGDPISESLTAVVDKQGYFEATLHPKKGNQFQDNLVCDIVFLPNDVPAQPASVVRVVGSHGEHLGFPKNPQVEVLSGENHVLVDLVHVP